MTIPAGASSATFQLSGVDDAVSDDPATVTVTGEAEGYDSTSDTVDVIDATRLRVTASTTSTTENAGDDAIQLTIERFGEDISGELVVSLASSDEGAIETPQTVTIPAGERDVVAMLDVKDDALLDGTQSAEITVSATGYEDSQVTIEVLDHESLSIEIATETVKESDGEGATTAVVTRSNSDTTELLRVSILNSDASEVVAPPIVEIPAGAQSVTFVIDAVNDLIVDGLQQVALTVMATGYVDGQDLLGVIDSGPGTWTNPIHAFDLDPMGLSMSPTRWCWCSICEREAPEYCLLRPLVIHLRPGSTPTATAISISATLLCNQLPQRIWLHADSQRTGRRRRRRWRRYGEAVMQEAVMREAKVRAAELGCKRARLA